MVERDVEKRIIEAIEALGIEGLTVTGAWQPATRGAVKGLESADVRMACAVAVAPMSFRAYRDPRAEMEVSIATAVRADGDPTGADVSEVAGRIVALLRKWNFAATGEGLEGDLAVEGFSPGGLLLTGGTAPEYDDGRGAWTATHNFTLTGVCPE